MTAWIDGALLVLTGAFVLYRAWLWWSATSGRA